MSCLCRDVRSCFCCAVLGQLVTEVQVFCIHQCFPWRFPCNPAVNLCACLQHLLVTFRTKVIARYDIELDMDATVLSVRVESDTGGLQWPLATFQKLLCSHPRQACALPKLDNRWISILAPLGHQRCLPNVHATTTSHEHLQATAKPTGPAARHPCLLLLCWALRNGGKMTLRTYPCTLSPCFYSLISCRPGEAVPDQLHQHRPSLGR
jgi:hypothetical protein